MTLQKVAGEDALVTELRKRLGRNRVMLGWIVTGVVVVNGKPQRESFTGAYAPTIRHAIVQALDAMGVVQARWSEERKLTVWAQRDKLAALRRYRLVLHPVNAV